MGNQLARIGTVGALLAAISLAAGNCWAAMIPDTQSRSNMAALQDLAATGETARTYDGDFYSGSSSASRDVSGEARGGASLRQSGLAHAQFDGRGNLTVTAPTAAASQGSSLKPVDRWPTVSKVSRALNSDNKAWAPILMLAAIVVGAIAGGPIGAVMGFMLGHAAVVVGLAIALGAAALIDVVRRPTLIRNPGP